MYERIIAKRVFFKLHEFVQDHGNACTTMSVPSGDDGTIPSAILPDPFQEGQTMLILVGLIASGKVMAIRLREFI